MYIYLYINVQCVITSYKLYIVSFAYRIPQKEVVAFGHGPCQCVKNQYMHICLHMSSSVFRLDGSKWHSGPLKISSTYVPLFQPYIICKTWELGPHAFLDAQTRETLKPHA